MRWLIRIKPVSVAYTVTYSLECNTTGSSPICITKKSCRSSSQLQGLYPSANFTSNFCTIAATAMRISNNPRFFPTQFPGPSANGMNADVSVRYFPDPESSQRSGMNESGDGEKLRGSLCMTYAGTSNEVPSAMNLKQ